MQRDAAAWKALDAQESSATMLTETLSGLAFVFTFIIFLRIVQNASLLLVEAIEEVDNSQWEADCAQTPGLRQFMADAFEAHSSLTFVFTFYFFFWRIV